MHGHFPIVERRNVPRYSARARTTTIVDGAVMRGCTILDFSERGARLLLGAPNPLPLQFELEFPTGQRIKVGLIWQRELVAGISFDRPQTILDRLATWNWMRRSQAEASERSRGHPSWP